MNMNPNTNYKTAISEMSMSLVRPSSCNNRNLENQEPKLENFLRIGGGQSLHLPSQTVEASSSGTIGLSMIKTWLRNNPSTSQPDNKNGNNDAVACTSFPSAQSLSLSMSTGTQSTSALPLLTATSCSDGEGGGQIFASENLTANKQQTGGIRLDNSQSSAIEAVPRKSIDTFGQRTSIYRGVTR